ncbi:hypothetical protein ACPWR0_01695 [Pandoraea pneumonica]|uniref:hypothetical protein n=1 Tax=Pandoraea pneumonica TaxID=2508299 RepID=UPI003CF2FB88
MRLRTRGHAYGRRKPVLLPALFFLLISTNPGHVIAAEESPGETTAWLIGLLKNNNGKTFCIPKETSVRTVVSVLRDYSVAHPELNDQFTDPMAVQVIARFFPCTSLLGDVSLRELGDAGVRRIEFAPKGEYATIDNAELNATLQRLQATTGHENDALIETITANSANYAPPVFYALAWLLYRQGRVTDALFWYNAGRIRSTFDARICTDATAHNAIGALTQKTPVALLRAQIEDPARYRDIAKKIVKWDESTPYRYDHRWISLHGVQAIAKSLNKEKSTPTPLTLPRDQWDSIAAGNRADFLKDVDYTLEKSKRAKSTE